MTKDQSYHEDAIEYNSKLAAVAEELAKDLGNPEVKKWCASVGKQHRFHAKRHTNALAKLNARKKTKDEPVVEESNTVLPEDQAETKNEEVSA